MALKQYVTYGAGEFASTMEKIAGHMHNINQHIVYMEEQGVGRRDDWRWEDMAARLRTYFEELRMEMKEFDTAIPFDDVDIKRKERGLKFKNDEVVDDMLPF
jgi:hypothetical protein